MGQMRPEVAGLGTRWARGFEQPSRSKMRTVSAKPGAVV